MKVSYFKYRKGWRVQVALPSGQRRVAGRKQERLAARQHGGSRPRAGTLKG